MQNLNKIVEQAEAQGITVKKFCSFCTNSASGELSVDDGFGNTIPVPICEPCVEALAKKYPEKFA